MSVLTQRGFEVRFCGAGYGSVSGTTRTPLVTLKGYFPPLGKVISTKNAVHPAAGGATLAIQVFGPEGFRGVLVYAAPLVSWRKLRAFGFVACHTRTSSGSCFVTTL